MAIVRSVALIALAVLAGGASAQKVVLRLNPPAGQKYAYAVTTDMVATGGFASSMKQSSTMTVKVVSNKAGKVALSMTTSQVKVTVPPNSPMKSRVAEMQKGMEGQTNQLAMDNRGRPVGADQQNRVMQAMVAGSGQSASGMFAFPEGAVGVGSTWTTVLDLKSMMGSQQGATVSGGKIPIVMKLIGFETRKARKVARIQTSMKGSVGIKFGAQASQMTMVSNATSLVDVATGMTVDSSSSSTMTTVFGKQSAKQVVTTSMKLK